MKISESLVAEIDRGGPINGIFRLWGGWFINTSVLPSRELVVNTTQQSFKQLLVHIHRKHPKLLNNWILHQDNTPPHKACCVSEFVEEHNNVVMEYPLYSPEFAPCDFWLFPAPKNAWSQNAKKRKVYGGVFRATFFAFHISQHFVPGSAFAWKVKGFCGLFFAASIKHKIRVKCEKCIVSVSYFLVCFTKTFVKYETCIAGLRGRQEQKNIKVVFRKLGRSFTKMRKLEKPG